MESMKKELSKDLGEKMDKNDKELREKIELVLSEIKTLK